MFNNFLKIFFFTYCNKICAKISVCVFICYVIHFFRADTCVETDDLIHLNVDEDIDCKDDRHLITVNSKANLLVVNPDWLISGTTVSNSLGCLRRAVLSERFKVISHQ